jgi:hypothetical protein
VIPLEVVDPVTRENAREAAQRELSKEIYHRYDDPWPVRVFDWITHWIDGLFDRVTAHAPGGGPGALVLLAVIVALLVFARWQLGPIRRETRARQALLDERSTTAAQHRDAATAAAAAGRWHDAVVARMRALARDLEERGILDERPGRTADELAREVPAVLPDVAQQVRAATWTFDEVVYGDRPATAQSYATVAEADEAVRRGRPAAMASA